MKYCINCGTELKDNDIFCSKCGTKLNSTASYNSSQTNAVYEQEFKESASSAPLVLGIIGVVFAILLPIVTYPCSIVGLVLANKDISARKTQKTSSRNLNIVALCIAAINSIIGILIY